MTSSLSKRLAISALAAALLAGGTSAFAAKPVDAFFHAINGSIDYRYMGYTDADGNYVSLAGQTILGARAELQFDPEQEQDLSGLRMAMVVPVAGAQSQYFLVEGSALIPAGHGRYYADMTSALFNGTVVDGRFSIETYAVDEDGNSVPLRGKMGAKSGFHFMVTRP